MSIAIERAISQATGAGWDEGRADIIGYKSMVFACEEKAFLDPSFWQALGRTRGWKKVQGRNTENAWFLHWHRFIDHLADGKDAESFFATLV